MYLVRQNVGFTEFAGQTMVVRAMMMNVMMDR